MKDRKNRKGKRKSRKDGKKNFFDVHRDSDSSAFDNVTSDEDRSGSSVDKEDLQLSKSSEDSNSERKLIKVSRTKKNS